MRYRCFCVSQYLRTDALMEQSYERTSMTRRTLSVSEGLASTQAIFMLSVTAAIHVLAVMLPVVDYGERP